MKRILFTLILLVYHVSANGSRGLKKCSEPKGSIGEILIRNCTKLSCKRRGQKGVWEESFNRDGCCPYQDTGIMIGDTLTTAESGDGCIKGILSCVGSSGLPVVDLKVENICSKCASEEQIDTISDTLDILVNKSSTISKDHSKGSAVTLQEVKFENGSVGASSIYDTSPSWAPKNAFLQGSDSVWHSGRDANGQGPIAFAYPHFIWYNFPYAFIPGRVSFRPRQVALCGAGGGCGATKYQFVGTNDEVCNQYSAWTVLCEDMSGISFTNLRSSKFCLVNDNMRESFKCLGISVFESSYTGRSEVSVNGIRMWKRKI